MSWKKDIGFFERTPDILSSEISKEDLYKWSLKMLHEIIGRGDVLELKYLEFWGMLTELIEIEDIDDACCNKLVNKLCRILNGDICASFSFVVQIPKKFVKNNLLHMEEIFTKYASERKLSKNEIYELKLITQKEVDIVNTLNDLLESQIISLLKLGYNFCIDEEEVDFDLKSTIFISEDVSSVLENDIVTKIITLLNCYNGKQCVWIYTRFNNGIGNISIQA